ncbi:nicotinic acid mononucleotide adenyltransferase [Roseovarius sp. 217]|nr:nicotinic acid mononucleotide adenyltransferase [Roseovarius sp. 217]
MGVRGQWPARPSPSEIMAKARWHLLFSLYTARASGNERAMTYALPHARPGQVIGLLGGSFDPPHAGHLHISREALKRFGLDRLWWLVSPGNPLKTAGPAPLDQRMTAARALVDHPRIAITDIEARTGTRHTAATLRVLRALCPGVRFVWLMGADNLAQFHLWQDWREILDTVPVGVLARPGQRISARLSPAARIYARARIPARDSQALGHANAPAWCFLNVPMMDISSTRLRAGGAWVGPLQT